MSETTKDITNSLARVIQVINSANEYLYISMPWWWNDLVGRNIAEVVEASSRRNVDVRIEMRPDKVNKVIRQRLRQNNIKISLLPQLHGKAICTEECLLITTANYSEKDMKQNINFSDEINSSEKIKLHKQEFLLRQQEIIVTNWNCALGKPLPCLLKEMEQQ